MFSPQGYLFSFSNRDGMMHKLGFQGFFLPVVNTEYDNFFFNQTYDVCLDVKFPYTDFTRPLISVNTGYKNFYKAWVLSFETLNGINCNFYNGSLKTIDAGGTLHYRINLEFFIIENITGILKTIYIEDAVFDNRFPSINRGNTVIHTSSYFDKIISKMQFPQGLGVDYNVTSNDYIFNSFSITGNFPLFKEPFMDPMITQGFGLSEDIYFSFYNGDIPRFKKDLLSASFVMGIQKRITLSLKIPIFSSGYIVDGQYVYMPSFSFEVRSYL